MKNKNEKEKAFNEFVKLQSEHSELSNQLARIETQATERYQALIDKHTALYAKLTTRLSEVEDQLIAMALAHPEWRTGRSVKTPFGTATFKKSSKLEFASLEAVLLLIDKNVGPKSLFEGLRAYTPENFKRVTTELNLEALEALGEFELARLGITRTVTDNVTIKPLKVSVEPKPASTPVAEAA